MRNLKGRTGTGSGSTRRPQREDTHRMNDEITGTEVRLIDENGAMVGVMSPREAMALAESRGYDLIEIAPNAKPPTCKIMDYGKWKYENKQKEKAAKKKQTVITIKEVQIRPRTDQHDIEVKLRHARRFLLEGDKVKLNLRFSGREMAHQEIGLKLLNTVSKSLEDIAIIETRPKLEGRQMFVLLSPDPVKVKEFLKMNKKPDVKQEELDAHAAENEAANEEEGVEA